MVRKRSISYHSQTNLMGIQVAVAAVAVVVVTAEGAGLVELVEEGR